jgi:hypothetical protein
MTEIKNFCEKHRITENQFFGKEIINRSLFLSSLTEIPEGFNPTVGGSLYLQLLTEIPNGFNPTVGGSLDLESVKEIPQGFNPIVGGYLDLRLLTEIPEGFNPIVGGSLILKSLTEIPEGFNPIVGGYLDLESVKEIPQGFNPIVGNALRLSSVTQIPEGFNPTVGGNLFLESITKIPEGFNLTVGWNLYLNSLTKIPEGFNPTVGNALRLSSVTEIPEGFNRSDYEEKNISLLQWDKYILCDDRFSEVISKKGNVWKLKDIGKDKIYYLVTDGNGKYAHGNSIKEAKDDLIYKISKRNVSQYHNIDLNKKYSFTECITMYRSITGSCSTGVKNFIETNGIKKQSYSVNDIILLTKNNYGNESFNKFFKVN